MRHNCWFGFIVVSLLCSEALAGSSPEEPRAEPTPHYLQRYDFSKDWFTYNIPVWRQVLEEYQGKPNIHYLEIGVFEGRSLIWMLENILTDPSARATGIDPFASPLKERFLSNVSKSGSEDKVITITGYSQVELRNLPLNAFDIIYIDGSHEARHVLSDAALSWELLKIGGLLIFDDYAWKTDAWPDELIPKVAIDAFITGYRSYLEVVHRSYQVIVRKRENPCSTMGCSPIGQYNYRWLTGELYHSQQGKRVEISDQERDVVERLLRSQRFGQAGILLDREMVNDEHVIHLMGRLDLDFPISARSRVDARGVVVKRWWEASILVLLGILGVIAVAVFLLTARRNKRCPGK